jgi:hypothetical protein
MGLKQLKARDVVGVVTVDIGVEGASVDDQRDEPTSARMISSIRSEISLWPLRPAAAASRRRRVLAPRCCSSAVRVTSAIVLPRRCASCRSLASRSSGSLTVVRRTYASIPPDKGPHPAAAPAARRSGVALRTPPPRRTAEPGCDLDEISVHGVLPRALISRVYARGQESHGDDGLERSIWQRSGEL